MCAQGPWLNGAGPVQAGLTPAAVRGGSEGDPDTGGWARAPGLRPGRHAKPAGMAMGAAPWGHWRNGDAQRHSGSCWDLHRTSRGSAIRLFALVTSAL